MAASCTPRLLNTVCRIAMSPCKAGRPPGWNGACFPITEIRPCSARLPCIIHAHARMALPSAPIYLLARQAPASPQYLPSLWLAFFHPSPINSSLHTCEAHQVQVRLSLVPLMSHHATQLRRCTYRIALPQAQQCRTLAAPSAQGQQGGGSRTAQAVPSTAPLTLLSCTAARSCDASCSLDQPSAPAPAPVGGILSMHGEAAKAQAPTKTTSGQTRPSLALQPHSRSSCTARARLATGGAAGGIPKQIGNPEGRGRAPRPRATGTLASSHILPF